MTNYQCVMPFVHEPWAREAVAACQLDHVLLVDNTKVNRGVMRSHNMGLAAFYERGCDWFIIMSAALRFGRPGGLDFLDILDRYGGEHSMISARETYGWHMVGFHRELLDAVGQWDAQLEPYGYDDVDFAIRAYKAAAELGRPRIRTWGAWPIEVDDAGMGHSLKIANVRIDNASLHAYLKRKWGRIHGGEWHEYWDRPFVDPKHPSGRALDWWPPKRHPTLGTAYSDRLPRLVTVDKHPILDAAVRRGEGWRVVA